jgi:hypothetical protein
LSKRDIVNEGIEILKNYLDLMNFINFLKSSKNTLTENLRILRKKTLANKIDEKLIKSLEDNFISLEFFNSILKSGEEVNSVKVF